MTGTMAHASNLRPRWKSKPCADARRAEQSAQRRSSNGKHQAESCIVAKCETCNARCKELNGKQSNDGQARSRRHTGSAHEEGRRHAHEEDGRRPHEEASRRAHDEARSRTLDEAGRRAHAIRRQARRLPQQARFRQNARTAGNLAQPLEEERQSVLRDPETCREPAALRLPAGGRRRAQIVGGSERSVDGSGRQASRGRNRGSSDGLRRLRRNHPRGRIRRRYRDRLGRRAVPQPEGGRRQGSFACRQLPAGNHRSLARRKKDPRRFRARSQPHGRERKELAAHQDERQGCEPGGRSGQRAHRERDFRTDHRRRRAFAEESVVVEIDSPLLRAVPAAERSRLRRQSQPRRLAPMLATLTAKHFSDPGWIFERKLDGVRCVALRRSNHVRLLSRNGLEIGAAYPELVHALARERCDDFIVDGEVVAFDGKQTSFSQLQRRVGVRDPDSRLVAATPVYLYLFDVLHVDGWRTTALSQLARKDLLRRMLRYRDPVRYTEHRAQHGERFLAEACREGWEGLIAKKADAPYVHKRSRCWLKFKC